jgi:hypothetical protein
VVDYIARCLECQKVKVENKHPYGFPQPYPIPKWKWEVMTIDFTTKLPRIAKKHDSIMLVMDRLIKDVHFIPMKITHKETNIENICMREISKLHGVPKEIGF